MKHLICLILSFFFSTLNSQTLFWEENFNFTGRLIDNGWDVYGDPPYPNAIETTDGLSYEEYVCSGIGNAAYINGNRSERTYKTFTSTNSGAIYASFLFEAKNYSGAELIYFNKNPFESIVASGNYAWMDIIGAGMGIFKFGLKIDYYDTIEYTTETYSYNTTYLVVLKYEFISGGSNNDEASLYVFESGIPASEPSSPTIGPLSNNDATNLGSIVLGYQGNPNCVIDGIRVSDSWNFPKALYVDIALVDDLGDGLSWSTAKKYLQSALAIASAGDVIFVAEGTYYPDEGAGQTNNDNTSTFQMIEGVDIYGGYPTGGGTRDPETYVTILDGDQDQSGTKNLNDAANVVRGASYATIDGFTIKNGNANTGTTWNGGGMYNTNVNPTINNCKFISNRSYYGGGGMFNDYSRPTITGCRFENNNTIYQGSGGAIDIVHATSNVDIMDCSFLNNYASAHGGGINVELSQSSVTVTLNNCTFESNSANSYGGGLRIYGADMKIERCTFDDNSSFSGGGADNQGGGTLEFINCIFINNTASSWGGAINNYGPTTSLIYCTSYGNSGAGNDGLVSYDCSVTITNSIFWDSNDPVGHGGSGTLTVTYSDIRQESGTYSGTGNINLDPSFISSTDLHLADDSPCIGTGTDAGVTNDRDGNIRPNPLGSIPDMGAYENPLDEPLPVELSSFTAKINGTSVELKWTTETEVNNYGFEIERCSNENWIKIGFVKGNGNCNSPKEYSFTDANPIGGCNFSYRLKQFDIEGTFEYSEIVEVVIFPKQFELSQNYPNPFNPSTNINFSISQKSFVNLEVFNSLGERINVLMAKELNVGNYKYEWNGQNLPSGIYFYQLKAGSFVEIKKMILLK